MSVESRRVPTGAAVLRGHITSAIRQAAAAELASVGYGRLSIEGVARRAGVAKTAVYRRWDSKLDMVLELVTAAAAQRFAPPDTGSLKGDVAMLLSSLTLALRHPLAAQIIPDLLAEAARTPRVATTLHEAINGGLREVIGGLTARAVSRGELPVQPDPELVADLVVGPVYWRLAVARAALPSDQLDPLADAVTASIRCAAGVRAVAP